MIEPINRYKKVLKTTGTEEQTRIPLKLIIEKIWCRQKENKFEHFFQISVHADMKSTNETYSNKRLQKCSSRGQITFGNQLQKFP